MIEDLEKSKYKADSENLDRKTLIHMLDRIRGQQEYETAVMRELDPYFQFQAKIQSKIGHIHNDKSKRTKI